MRHRPADMNQLGNRIVDLAIGEAVEDEESTRCHQGGAACAGKLTAEQRPECARKATVARWALA